MMEIKCWKQAHNINYTLPRLPDWRKHPFTPHHRSFCDKALAVRHPIDPDRAKMNALIDFALREQLTRWETNTRDGFTELASQVEHEVDPKSSYYSPRHGWDIVLFSNEYLDLFEGITGLDVGCRVFPGYTPHYEYYRAAKANMLGIDILLDASDPRKGLFKANILNLTPPPFQERGIFDFITVAMIFGNGSPVNSVLGVAAGLSELARIINNSGLIYFAEIYPDINVAYIAQRMGMRAFVNRQHKTELKRFPCGLFLIKTDVTLENNRFHKILEELEANMLELPDLTTPSF